MRLKEEETVAILSVIVALVMAFSSIGGFTSALKAPVTAEVEISADREGVDALMANTVAEAEKSGLSFVIESVQKTKDSLLFAADLLNAIDFRAAMDQDTFEFGLLSGGAEIVTIGGRKDENGFTLASSLLDTTVITASNEELEQMQKAMAESGAQLPLQVNVGTSVAGVQTGAGSMDMNALPEALKGVDQEQIAKDATEALLSALNQIGEKGGQPETGEFAVDGVTFAAKMPVEITYDELGELIMNSVKEFLTKDSFSELLKGFGTDSAKLTEQLDQRIQELKDQPAEQKFDTVAAIYSNGDGSGYMTLDLTRKANEEQLIAASDSHVGFGKIDAENSKFSLRHNASGTDMQMDALFAPDGSAEMTGQVKQEETTAEISVKSDKDGNMDAVVEIPEGDMPFKVTVSNSMASESGKCHVEIFVGGTEKPLVTLNATRHEGAEFLSRFSGEDLTEIPVSRLMDSEDTAGTQIQFILMGKALLAVNTLIQNMPAESGKQLMDSVQQMMAPKTTTP